MADALKQIKASGSLPVTYAFDVDQRTGFMSPQPPISRLPRTWEVWETTLDLAVEAKIQLGDKVGLTEVEAAASETWRAEVRKMPVLSTSGLGLPVLLRRAHLVLAYLLHFYIQSMPPSESVVIPRSIGIPMLQIAAELDIPPVLTFSDTVLYNWDFRRDPMSDAAVPTLDNICTQTMFTNLTDEEEFYLCSARIELRGVEVLELMRMTMDETFVGDAIAVRRIKDYLHTIAGVIDELQALLLDVKKSCDPDVYYSQVRPWFRGEDSTENGNKWIFEGLEDYPELHPPTEVSGPSAGQSSMVHVMDIFFGVDHQASSPGRPTFMSRMQSYMPRNHRLFLDHLKANPRPLRAFVMDANDADLLLAFNHAVTSLKQFRDSHMIIATLYILGPARRAAAITQARSTQVSYSAPKGTGGSDLAKFLKDTRTRTTETLIP